MTPDNLIVHIVLPRGLALTNGATLDASANLEVIGRLTPWYCSIQQVRLNAGIYLNKLPDTTIAGLIWQASQQADSFTYNFPADPIKQDLRDPTFRKWRLFQEARQNYTMYAAAYDGIQNVFDLVGVRGSLTLANFSTARQNFSRDEGMPKKLTTLAEEMAKWAVVLKTGGELAPGGHILPKFAQKGFYDTADDMPGRLWATTGMGANLKTVPGLGSKGKPVKYGSPPIITWRTRMSAFNNIIGTYPSVVLG